MSFSVADIWLTLLCTYGHVPGHITVNILFKLDISASLATLNHILFGQFHTQGNMIWNLQMNLLHNYLIQEKKIIWGLFLYITALESREMMKICCTPISMLWYCSSISSLYSCWCVVWHTIHYCMSVSWWYHSREIIKAAHPTEHYVPIFLAAVKSGSASV